MSTVRATKNVYLNEHGFRREGEEFEYSGPPNDFLVEVEIAAEETDELQGDTPVVDSPNLRKRRTSRGSGPTSINQLNQDMIDAAPAPAGPATTDTTPPYFQQDSQTRYTDAHTPRTSLQGHRGELNDNPPDPRDPSLQEEKPAEEEKKDEQ